MNQDLPVGRDGVRDADPPAAAGGVEPDASGMGLSMDVASADDDLRASLAGLSQLASGQMDLRAALTRVAEFAVAAIPGADGAGLTLLEAGHADTIVASAPFVADVDAIQYGIDEGPCISAVAQAQTVRSGDLDRDPQWPEFGPRIGHLGVHSALSLPLLTVNGVVGAMNVYAHERDAFDDYAARVGELFAAPAAIAVQNAQVLAQARRLAEQLQVALARQSVIDQATGVVMSRVGNSPDQALAQLQHSSEHENEPLHIIAARVVAEAVQCSRTGSPES